MSSEDSWFELGFSWERLCLLRRGIKPSRTAPKTVLRKRCRVSSLVRTQMRIIWKWPRLHPKQRWNIDDVCIYKTVFYFTQKKVLLRLLTLSFMNWFWNICSCSFLLVICWINFSAEYFLVNLAASAFTYDELYLMMISLARTSLYRFSRLFYRW